ncbi:MAG TPA: hypothetical protein VFX49_16890 [Chloroflexota bacterium]|nr:hypothetical protein [Chloroflexota bacterium]
MNSLTLIVLAGVAIWVYRPLRVFLVERTNRTVKILLVVLPLFFVGRAVYTIYRGEQDDLASALLLVGALLAIWAALVWLGNTLEKRRPTKVRPPDLAMLSRMPGVPKLPAVVTSPHSQRAAEGLYAAASNPEVQRAARAAAQAVVNAAGQIDTKDVAGSLGRAGGRWAARLKRSMASDKG